MTNHKLLPLTAICVLASACSTGGQKPSTNMSSLLLENTGQNGRACIDASDIRGYGVLKGDVISIDAFNEYYLATVLPGCTDLQMATRALFKERYGEVCGGGMDKIRTGGNTCTIRNIFEFDNREQAFAAHDAVIERQKQLREADD